MPGWFSFDPQTRPYPRDVLPLQMIPPDSSTFKCHLSPLTPNTLITCPFGVKLLSKVRCLGVKHPGVN